MAEASYLTIEESDRSQRYTAVVDLQSAQVDEVEEAEIVSRLSVFREESASKVCAFLHILWSSPN
jgi:hypothetical protein